MTLPKLNLRDLFWLVAIVAMGLGWWVQSHRAAERHHDLNVEYVEILSKHIEVKTALFNSDYEVVHRGRPRVIRRGRAPAFWAHTASGQIVHIHDESLPKKWVLVEFWDSTVPKRAADQATLQTLRKEFLDDDRLLIFSVCVDLEFEPWHAYVNAQPDLLGPAGDKVKFYSDARWWQLSLGVADEDQRKEHMESYGLVKLPQYLLLRPDRSVAAANIPQGKLKEVLTELLGK